MFFPSSPAPVTSEVTGACMLEGTLPSRITAGHDSPRVWSCGLDWSPFSLTPIPSLGNLVSGSHLARTRITKAVFPASNGMDDADSQQVSKKKILEVEVFSPFHLSYGSDPSSAIFLISKVISGGSGRLSQRSVVHHSCERIFSQLCTELKTAAFTSYWFPEDKLRRMKAPAGFSGGD